MNNSTPRMPSLPQIHQGRQQRDEGPPAWAQAPSPFNTPPPTGDSVESISDLLGLSMPIATRPGENFTLNSNFQQYQVRPNQEYYSWNQNSSPFDNTPPPQGDSFDTNITDLLSLNMPRGSLLGNTHPNTYNVNTPFDCNSSFQSPTGMKYACYQTPRFEPPTISTPRKSGRAHDLTPTSPFSQVSPICPPQLIGSPPYANSRSNSEEYHSPTQRPADTIKSNADHSNVVQNLSQQVFCPTTEQELSNIKSLIAIRKENELVNRIIEHTSRLLLAAVNSPEVKSNEPPQFPQYNNQEKSVVRYQQRALVASGSNEVAERSTTWSGILPPRIHNNPTYSCKVFLGGVPWDITEITLVQAFSKFGSIKIEWPGKDMPNQANQPKGYAYIIFESEKKVKALLDYCIHDFSKGGNWYYRLSSRKMKSKDVQVIPWAVSDSNFAQVSQKLDPQKTVFVGALHGMINAKALAKIMNDLFGGVIYAGLDTDKYKYPIGSARVTFNNHRSYMKAVMAAFIDIKTTKFSKKVQVNPYLEDSPCSICSIQHGPYFCRDIACFNYFCRGCWTLHHSSESLQAHKQLTRNSKNHNINNMTVCLSHSSLQPHNSSL